MSRRRRSFARLVSICILGFAAGAAMSPTARALDQGSYSMEVLVEGVPLREYAARGTRYVEALEGREYSVRLGNRTGERIAVALSVDGLNVVDAKTTTAREGSKWILDPWETIILDGWQTGSGTARRFFFTTEDRSYGAWLGRTRDLGVVTAAVFRERYPHPLPPPPPYYEPQWGPESDSSGSGESTRRQSARAKEAPASAPTEAPPSAGRDDAAVESHASKRSGNVAQPRPSDDYAATGIGRELDHRVRRVRFDAQDRPAAVLTVRYEYRDALARLGVFPPTWERDPLARRENARGFEDTGYAPDPYRRRR